MIWARIGCRDGYAGNSDWELLAVCVLGMAPWTLESHWALPEAQVRMCLSDDLPQGQWAELSSNAGFLNCPWEVILQHLSSITVTPKDWCWAPQCHLVPLSPIEIPEGQAKENLLLCPAHLPAGWGEGQNLVHCGSDKESFPSRHLLPNWEPDMESRWEAAIHIHCGHNLQWALNFGCEYLLLQSTALPTHHIHLLAHSFIHQLLQDTLNSKHWGYSSE